MIAKEIGGYIELDEYTGKEYYANLVALNSARNALVYLSRAKKISKLYIPYYLCDSISKVCDREEIEYERYHIDKDFLPMLDKTISNSEYIYIVNYYGLLDNKALKELKDKHNNIIIDNAQAFFQEPLVDVDTIYSCRKFFGVTDGAYLSTNVMLNEHLDTDCSFDRVKYVLGRYETENGSAYFEDFRNNEELFDDLCLKNMSKLTRNMLKAIDYEHVKQIRDNNYTILKERLDTINMIDTKSINGPYAYPFMYENGTELRKYLISKKVYIATLWPNVLELDDSIEKLYAKNILPLPCDQRYNEQDMNLICDYIDEYVRINGSY